MIPRFATVMPPAIPQLAVAVTSAGLATFFFVAGETQFPGGAEHFTSWAQAIADGTQLSLSATQREVGYPLVVLLSGWPWTHSFFWLLVIQAGMAAAMPLMVFSMLRRASVPMATLVALIAIVSLVPYVLQKFIHHDQAHIFFQLVAAACAVLFSQTGKTRYLYAAAIAAIACTLTRPISLLVLPIILITGLWLEWSFGRLRERGLMSVATPYVVCVALFTGAMWASDMHRRAIFGIAEEPSYTGAQLFYPMYVNSAEYGVTITPELGPNTAFLYDNLRKRLGSDPEASQMVSDMIAIAPKGNDFAEAELRGFTTDEFVARFFEKPNPVYFMMFTATYDKEPGLSDALLGSSLEIARAYPLYVLQFTWRNFVNFLFSPGKGRSMWNTAGVHQQGHFFLLTDPDMGNAGHFLPPQSVAELSRVVQEDWPAAGAVVDEAAIYYRRAYVLLNWLTVVPMLLGVAAATVLSLSMFSLRVRERVRDRLPRALPAVAAIMVPSFIVLYNGLVASATAEPIYRYHEIGILLQFVAAGASALLVWDAMRLILRRRPAYRPLRSGEAQ